jgi:hypothetical protein
MKSEAQTVAQGYPRNMCPRYRMPCLSSVIYLFDLFDLFQVDLFDLLGGPGTPCHCTTIPDL